MFPTAFYPLSLKYCVLQYLTTLQLHLLTPHHDEQDPTDDLSSVDPTVISVVQNIVQLGGQRRRVCSAGAGGTCCRGTLEVVCRMEKEERVGRRVRKER